MEPQKIHSKEFLTMSMKTGIDPSFYHSQPYFDFTGAKAYKNDHWMWIELEGWILFPPIRISKAPRDASAVFPRGDIWCDDIPDLKLDPEKWQREFLDYEYIFNPKSFHFMDGGKWNTFRKNVRKWPRKNPGYMYVDELTDMKALSALCADWFTPRAEAVEDAEVIVNFVLHPHEGIRRKFMYTKDWKLVGVNVWDWNYKYINYRLCIRHADERFLDEFMRYAFYVDPSIQASRKLVNDGGSLGKEGLERFKDKMQPLKKRQRYKLIKVQKP